MFHWCVFQGSTPVCGCVASLWDSPRTGAFTTPTHHHPHPSTHPCTTHYRSPLTTFTTTTRRTRTTVAHPPLCNRTVLDTTNTTTMRASGSVILLRGKPAKGKGRIIHSLQCAVGVLDEGHLSMREEAP